jgi:hypothetical protein
VDKVKELLENSEDYTGSISTRGTWDVNGLAEGLKGVFGKGTGGEFKAKKIKVDKILKLYYSGSGLKNKGGSVRARVKEAVKLNGWEMGRSRVDGDYIVFEVRF